MVVGICSSIGILEPHAKFQQNRMGGFRDRCFEGVFYEVSFLSWGAGSGSLPTRPEEVGKSPDHLAEIGGALRRYLAYVVEGHASACPQTVGVDASMWR